MVKAGGTKELLMHILMYGTSVYSELSEFREMRADKSLKVSYWSGALSEVELFFEFIFEVINERVTPLVLAFEVAKIVFRLREYRQLVQREGVNVLINAEQYKQLKAVREREDSICKLIRSQK